MAGGSETTLVNVKFRSDKLTAVPEQLQGSFSF
jgi:hypothetical protein